MAERAQSEDGGDCCHWHDTLVETLGRSGNNGRVGNLERGAKMMSARIDKLEAMVLKVLFASAAGGGIVAGLTKLIG